MLVYQRVNDGKKQLISNLKDKTTSKMLLNESYDYPLVN